MTSKLPVDLEALRVRLYTQLAGDGRVASAIELANEFGVTIEIARSALQKLAGQRHVVLDAAGEVELAHPFATRDFGFSVKSDHVLWWGGCAWDSFAIPHLVRGASPSLVATTCPECDTAHAWLVSTEHPPTGEQVVHFLVPVTQVWNDVIHACENQRVFCSENCVDGWLERTGNVKGTVFGLNSLWAFASDWYTGRLDFGYQRRQPEQAAEYLRSVGLVGPFWGNAV